ncbi:MAG: GerMN domain-containing protein [Lachnospiraceae bacterium]|nr:GerMN domain-containing protein [Lachnospiraceae bacterium]
MKKRMIQICMLLLAFLLCACGGEEEPKGTTYPIYFVSNSETKIEKREVNVNDVAYEEQLEYVLGALSIMPDKLDYKAPLRMGFSLLDYEVEDGKITLNVSKDYLKLSVTTEVLVRGAIVKTLTGMPHINFVCITVEDEPLRDSLGTLVG